MKNYLHKLVVTVAATFALLALPAVAQDCSILVDDSGPGMSTNGSFVNGVWTPSGGAVCIITIQDINAELADRDVVMATDQSVNFALPVGPIVYFEAPVAGRTLTVGGFDVDISQLRVDDTLQLLNLTINAIEAVNIGLAADGVDTNGGAFTASGASFDCQNSCIDTAGGDVVLNFSGSVDIGFGGLRTAGGAVTATSATFNAYGGGVDTGGATPAESGDVSVSVTGAVSISDGGVTTGGAGDVEISGGDIDCSGACVETESGDIALLAVGSLNINASPRTGGGSFTSTGTSLNISGLYTEGGGAQLTHTGSIDIDNSGINTCDGLLGGDCELGGGGNVFMSGSELDCQGFCVRSGGGNARFDIGGPVAITNGGVYTHGSNFHSSGTDFQCDSACINTGGGRVLLQHQDSAIEDGGVASEGGDIDILAADLALSGGGLQSGGGDISVRATGNVPISNGGITSEGGDILVYAADILELDLPTPIRSGSNSVDGGSIILHAVNAMTIRGPVSSESGTGGVYYVEDGVIVDTEPVLGSGDISFYLRSEESFLPLIEESTPVPTLPVYLLLVLSGLLALFALPRMRALNR